MPKRSRSSHIPSQVRRRKVRRPKELGASLAASETFKEIVEAEAAAVPLLPETPPVQPPRMGRRLEAATRSRESAGVRTAAAGQLPVFERSYLVRELTQIGAISGALLLFLVILYFVMR